MPIYIETDAEVFYDSGPTPYQRPKIIDPSFRNLDLNPSYFHPGIVGLPTTNTFSQPTDHSKVRPLYMGFNQLPQTTARQTSNFRNISLERTAASPIANIPPGLKPLPGLRRFSEVVKQQYGEQNFSAWAQPKTKKRFKSHSNHY